MFRLVPDPVQDRVTVKGNYRFVGIYLNIIDNRSLS
jgi:hypothetical protein